MDASELLDRAKTASRLPTPRTGSTPSSKRSSGYSRPLIRAADFRAFIDEHTFNGDRVRP
jgi:hypothetical protein